MKYNRLLLAAALLCCAVLFSFRPESMYFEGVITYKVTVKTKDKSLDAKDILKKFGDRSELYFKGGDYRQDYTGTEQTRIYFDHLSSRKYTRKGASDTFLVKDMTNRPNSQTLVNARPGSKRIAGYYCDEMVMHISVNGKEIETTHYFFSREAAAIDPEWFSKAEENSMNTLYNTAKAIPLGIVMEMEGYTVTMMADDVKTRALNANDVHLPANAIVVNRK